MELNVRCKDHILEPRRYQLSMDVLLFSFSDIDECADGFVECDGKSTCVNLPGWYHCECRDGYHDNGLFSASGESCVGEWSTSNKYNYGGKKGFFFYCPFRIATWINQRSNLFFFSFYKEQQHSLVSSLRVKRDMLSIFL